MEKGHGRIERRSLRTTPSLTCSPKWKGARQGFELVRERTLRGVTTREVVYGITSLSPEAATASRLLTLLRDHWKIENTLHYVRDVTLGEDRCRVRRGAAPQVLAALRNVVMHLLSGIKAPSHPAAIEYLQIHHDEARRLIGIPHPE